MDATHLAATLLEVRQLGKRFAQRQGRDQGREPSPWVIQDLSFSVQDGEFLTIVGPSGAGKSTLLNIIAQTDTASAGEIVFDGATISSRDPRALKPGINRRLQRLPLHINDEAFADALVAAWGEVAPTGALSRAGAR